jgi:hypothetical protein
VTIHEEDDRACDFISNRCCLRFYRLREKTGAAETGPGTGGDASAGPDPAAASTAAATAAGADETGKTVGSPGAPGSEQITAPTPGAFSLECTEPADRRERHV